MNKETMPRFRSIEYYSDYEWTMEQVCEVADKNIKRLQSQLNIANKKLDEIEGYVKLRNDELNDFKKSTINDLFNANIEKFIKDILSIIGGEEVSNE